MRDVSAAIIDMVRAHAALGPPIVFVLALGESFAFISLLMPATVILLALGGLAGAADLRFWPLWWAAAAGAAIGDWASFWLGFHFKEAIGAMWPLSRHPTLLPRGRRVFERWGWAAVFAGRFFGPLRCVMPLVAGICGMPFLPFQIANLTSAVVWATVMLSPGRLAFDWFGR
jgi:membrane protein DedA with SNARE-associated domain